MTMEKLPAYTGWLWVKQGFTLFRKQPFEMATLFLAYMFLMLACGIIPLIGQLLPLLLAPVFSMAFMQACVDIEQGKRVFPNRLLTGFRSPRFTSLMVLGVLYLCAAVFAMWISRWVDDGVFWQVMRGKLALDSPQVQSSNMPKAMFVAAAVYTPAAMAFWYAAPLVAWKDMGVGKAIFYSFFAVLRATKAFLVYGLAWLAIGAILPAVISAILGLVLGKAMALGLLMPLSIILTVVVYCSFYPTYTSIFGRPYSSVEAEE